MNRPVLHLRKARPAVPVRQPTCSVPLNIRRLRVPEEIDDWLRIQNACFARTKAWNVARFWREFELRLAATPPRVVILAAEHQRPPRSSVGALLGAAAVGWEAVADERHAPYPAISRSHDVLDGTLSWLAVHPAWQRQGIGRSLLAAAEELCWSRGCGTIQLQTLQDWQAATRLYRRSGYALER